MIHCCWLGSLVWREIRPEHALVLEKREWSNESRIDLDSSFPTKYGQNISASLQAPVTCFQLTWWWWISKYCRLCRSWSLSHNTQNIRKIKTKGGPGDHLIISQQMWSWGSPEFNFTRARNRKVRHKLSHKWTKLTLNSPLLSVLHIT